MKPCIHMPKVSLYHDGELPGEDRIVFETHLASCPTCAQELEELRALSRRLSAVERPSVPAPLVKSLYTTTAAVRERVVLRTAEWLTAAAAAALITACGWLWQSPHYQASETAPPDMWELAAVGIRSDIAGGENQQLAEWLTAGLTVENAND